MRQEAAARLAAARRSMRQEAVARLVAACWSMRQEAAARLAVTDGRWRRDGCDPAGGDGGGTATVCGEAGDGAGDGDRAGLAGICTRVDAELTGRDGSRSRTHIAAPVASASTTTATPAKTNGFARRGGDAGTAAAEV